MKQRNLMGMSILAVLLLTASRPAFAWSRPEMNFALGTTFGADSAPAEGGFSVAFTPMWPIADHARFGASLFADDIGSTLGKLYDRNDHTNLGATALAHRWAWGAAWRGDVEVGRRDLWAASVSGTLGLWRIEDDARGDTFAAASAVGLGLGGEVRRSIATGQTLGLVARWQRLFSQRNESYRRVQQYASAGLEWGWTGAQQP